MRGAAFGLLGATGRIASITAQVVNGALITDTPLLFKRWPTFGVSNDLNILVRSASAQRRRLN